MIYVKYKKGYQVQFQYQTLTTINFHGVSSRKISLKQIMKIIF